MKNEVEWCVSQQNDMSNQTAAVVAAIATSVNWERKGIDLQAIIMAANQGKLGGPLTDWLVAQSWNDEVAQVAPEPTEKFGLLVDLGTITVPADYDHANWLAKFKVKHQGGEKKSFYSYNDAITDEDFPNPSRILKPGDRLWVRAFEQVFKGTTTSDERMAFLATQKAIHAGAQGASLVFDQKRDQLPKGKWYASMDEKKRLWKDAYGRHGVPGVGARSDGDFRFNLGYFEHVWNEFSVLLCLCDVPPDHSSGE